MTLEARRDAEKKWAKEIDPYARCAEHCTHDLNHGALVAELIGPHDGPHPDLYYDKIVDHMRRRGFR